MLLCCMKTFRTIQEINIYFSYFIQEHIILVFRVLKLRVIVILTVVLLPGDKAGKVRVN